MLLLAAAIKIPEAATDKVRRHAGGLDHAHDEGVDVGQAHDRAQRVDSALSQVDGCETGGDQHEQEQEREQEGRAQFQRIARADIPV